MTLQSEFAATLVDEWYRSGVREAVLSPGSRSSPLALALLSDQRLRVHVRLDERSACFFALGLALADGRPSLMLTTSGTAAAELHAGVVEADLAGAPVIVLTADRPPEFQTVGATQTIAQHGLYGDATRYAVDLGVPDPATRPYWRSFAARLVAEATSGPRGPGPVHANLPFREPLVGPIGELPAPSDGGSGWHSASRARGTDEATIDRFVAALAGTRRGCFVVGGRGVEHDPLPLVELANLLGWPILADARGIPREPFEPLIAHSDGLLRAGRATTSLRPELIVRIGSPHVGRVIEGWLTTLGASGVPQLLFDPFGHFEAPERTAGAVLGADPPATFRGALGALGAMERDEAWLTAWRGADDAADSAILAVLEETPGLSEPGVARRLAERVPPGSTIFSSASMPIRDLEWFAPRRHQAARLLANRGANGIDGVTSTLLGVAAAEQAAERGPVFGLIGDLALLHDLSGLVWGDLEQRPPATLVVIDNGGGGIFNFLAYPDLVDEATFERAFGTPQSVELPPLLDAFGIAVEEVSEPASLDRAIDAGAVSDRLSAVLVRTNRKANVQIHADLNTRIAAAVDALG